MRYIICLLGFTLFFSCNNDKKEARVLLEEARSLYDHNEYLSAKHLLDSLKTKYPRQYPIQKERQVLVKHIELAEQTRNVQYCDSLLQLRLPEVELLKKDFIFERDTAYETIGKYIHKSQRIEYNIQHSYLRPSVNERGEMSLSSVYYGERPIKHTALKVSLKGGEYAQTESVPYDGSNNYAFTDGGMTTETVTYTKGKDNGVTAFISSHRGKELIRLTYLGEREYITTLSEANRNAIEATLLLSEGLSDIENVRKQMKIAEIKIEYLNEKMKTGD